ncbi:MAG: hypothetical protein U0905_14945 [Pirellulales bacterium]
MTIVSSIFLKACPTISFRHLASRLRHGQTHEDLTLAASMTEMIVLAFAIKKIDLPFAAIDNPRKKVHLPAEA